MEKEIFGTILILYGVVQIIYGLLKIEYKKRIKEENNNMYIVYKENDDWEITEIMYYTENEEIAKRYCEEMNDELCKKYKYQLYKYCYKRINKLEYKKRIEKENK